ncbi:hypothetical protein GCM10027048_23960 [Hymenobacter coalescens]
MRTLTSGGAVLSAGLLLMAPARAQQLPTTRPGALVLKTNVLQPLVRGYHLEVETPWRAYPRLSLGLTLQWYQGHVTELSAKRPVQAGERVRGYGAELLPRLYFPGSDPDLLSGFYVGFGPHLQRFKLDFQEYGWQEQLTGDGLKIYVYEPQPYTETIRRYGAAAVAGYQGPLELGPLFLDFYAGVGWRTARSTSAFATSRYRASALDYGARGVYFPVGFKLGVKL